LTAQTGSRGKDMGVSTKIFQSPCQDETLTSNPPVLWIPKDELGVAEDEIVHTRETYNSIGISCDGASLNAQGKLILGGQPPDWRLNLSPLLSLTQAPDAASRSPEAIG
ncbi:hypothetical protein V502_01375, partial [Pseudogymnoascus sp. VKM F-4520 (FW-2644)]